MGMPSCIRRVLSVLSICLLMASFVVLSDNPARCESQYPDIFIQSAQLKGLIGKPGIKIVDTRGADAYAKGHLPGAVNVPWYDLHVPEREGLRNKFAADAVIEQALAKAGLTYEDQVVLCDAGTITGGPSYFVLAYAGFPNVRVLDGGMSLWMGELSTEPATPKPSAFRMTRRNPGLVIGKEDVAARLNDSGTLVLEGRVVAAYRDGHMPGARSLDPAVFLKDRKYLKPRAEILQELSKQGITPDKRLILTCGSGGAAARNFMVLRDVGFKDLTVYMNAWDEWSIDTTKLQELGAPNVTFGAWAPGKIQSLGPKFFTESDLRAALEAKSVVVLDVRSEADFNLGRVPGAVNVPWESTLDAKRNPKPAEELVTVFSGKGITPDKHVVVFHRGGMQLSYAFTLLKLLGYPQVSVYAGSWHGWEMPAWKGVPGR